MDTILEATNLVSLYLQYRPKVQTNKYIIQCVELYTQYWQKYRLRVTSVMSVAIFGFLGLVKPSTCLLGEPNAKAPIRINQRELNNN